MATNSKSGYSNIKKIFALGIILLFLFSACSKTNDATVVLAGYTLGSGGNCTGAVVSGRFVADTALTAANTVTITVDVKVAGPYWISTNTINGISFSQVGTFDSTGPQTAILTGTGTPVDTGITTFTLTALNGLGDSCTFSVETIQGVPPHYYITCFLDGIYRNFSDSAGATNGSVPGTSGFPGLDIRGIDTVLNSSQRIELGINNPASVGIGNFSDTSFSQAYFNYLDSFGESWSVHNSAQPSFIVVVTGINNVNVQGTFNGTIKNQQGTGLDSIAVTNGMFSVPLK